MERSGQMAPSLRKLSNNFEGNVGGDGPADHEINLNNTEPEKPTANGSGVLHPLVKDTAGLLAKVKEEDTMSGTRESNLNDADTTEISGCTNTAAVDSDKPVSAATDGAAALLPADLKDEKAVSGGGALLERRTSLGDLLKGHAFEQEASTTPKTTELETPMTQESARSSERPLTPRTRPTNLKVNGGHPTQASISSTTAVASAKTMSTRPSEPSTMKDTQAASAAPTAASAANASTSPKSPKLPQDASKSSSQPLSKTSLPKQAVTTKPINKTTENQSKQGPAQRPSRPLAVSKAPTGANTTSSLASAPKHTSSNKKSGPTSPPTKAHPKSPTRPVRLPASLTAPTAASVAKLGGAPPSHSPSHTSTTTISKPSAPSKDRTPAVTSQMRPKAPRTSLPAPSAAPPKPKVRTSIAGSKPADGGFLARMMRPTQSSASKTHEKIEPKTPPKKAAPSRSHKLSEGVSEHGAQKSVEGELEASEVPEDVVEPYHISNPELAQEGTNLDANAVSGTVPEVLGAKGEEYGVNGDSAAPSEAVST